MTGEKFPIVSIILPTFNGSKYVRNSVQSCLNQTYTNIELIIVDDGSTDETPGIVRSFKGERIKLIRHEFNRGLPHALNTGFAASRGTFLTWTSDDNFYADNAIERMVSFLVEHGFDFVYCDFFRFKGDNHNHNYIVRLPDNIDLKKGNSVGPCFLYSREVFDKVGDYDPEAALAEDYDYWLRVSRAYALWHLPEPLYYYREHDRSLYVSKYYDVKIADYLVRLKNRVSPIEEVSELLVNLILDKMGDFFRINDSYVRDSIGNQIICILNNMTSGNLSKISARAEISAIAEKVGAGAVDPTASGEFLFIGMLDETLSKNLLESPVKRMENLVLIESREASVEVKGRLRKMGVDINKKKPLLSLAGKFLGYRKKNLVIVQPYRNLKLFISLFPFIRKGWLNGNYVDRLTLGNVLRDEAMRLFGNMKRAVSLSIKRRKLNGVRVYPYEIGYPNDYSLLEKSLKNKKIIPDIPVSVVIPFYNRPKELDRTLAGLVLQDYPRDLVEIIIADDGSDVNCQEITGKYSDDLEIRVTRQEDEGYRLARVRNLGIKSARGEVVVLLDCDMLPSPRFLQSHMKWFHITEGNIVTLGDREFINGDGLSPDEIVGNFEKSIAGRKDKAPDSVRDEKRPYRDWRVHYYENSSFLKKSADPYRYASGGNISFRKSDAIEAGLFDEEFNQWGGEDTEFFYRMFLKGAYFIPELGAKAYHQNHPDTSQREEGRALSLEILERKIPDFRKKGVQEGDTPKVSIYMPAFNAVKFIKDAIDSVILQTFDDWELCICDDGSTDGTLEFVSERYGEHSKIRIERIGHSGIGAASNHAVRMCRGKYIGQLDSDDMLKPEALPCMVGFLDKNPQYGLVYSDYEFIDEKGDYISSGYSYPTYDPLFLLESMIVHPFRMFRSLYWYRTPGFNTEIKNAVDYDMYLKLSEVADFFHIRKTLYSYRMHGTNTSVQAYNRQSENHLKVAREAIKRRNLSWQFSVDPKNKRRISLG